MRKHIIVLSALLASACASHRPALPVADPQPLGLARDGLARVDSMLQAYVAAGKYASLYASIARNGQLGYERTAGWKDVARQEKLERTDIFRIYSMTKPIVAAGAMILVDQGRLSLDDPVAKYVPSFANIKVFAGGSAQQPVLVAPDSAMTVRHLLTHTSGLSYGLTDTPADSLFRAAALYQPDVTLEEFVDSLAKLPLLFNPGTQFSYSAGLEVVGRVIEVASGQPLDVFLKRALFGPLGMKDTQWRVTPDIADRVVTLYAPGDSMTLRPVGADNLLRMFEPSARFLWASGGLLSTPDDYLRFAQMLLNKGMFEGRRVLSEASVDAMTHNQVQPALTPVPRRYAINDDGLGFGLAGSVKVDASLARRPGPNGIYRWSGYVGTYFWIDPVNQLIAMIWSQLSPGGTWPLERDFQQLVYDAVLKQPKPRVIPGADRLFSEYAQLINGKRIALVSNHSGRLTNGVHLADTLFHYKPAQLKVLFGMEYNIRSNDYSVARDPEHTTDPETGLPKYSLYGEVHKPTPEMFRDVDVIVFDIQEVGARFYEHINILGFVMEAAAENGIDVIVLDRPNPITGLKVDGFVTDPDRMYRFGSYARVPVVHGMTMGELANYYVGENVLRGGAKPKLTVVPMQHWTRAQWYDQTQLEWRKPSPNLLTLRSLLAYVGTCLFEAVNVSEGRGTDQPFEVIGAPWLDNVAAVRLLEGLGLKGVSFDTLTYTPVQKPYHGRPPELAGEQLRGVRMIITDRNLFEPYKAGVALLWAVHKLHADRLVWNEDVLDRLVATPRLRTLLEQGASPEQIYAAWAPEVAAFRAVRSKYLLY